MSLACAVLPLQHGQHQLLTCPRDGVMVLGVVCEAAMVAVELNSWHERVSGCDLLA